MSKPGLGFIGLCDHTISSPLILTGLKLLVVMALSYFAGLFMPESV